jgi:ABC-type lipoprotein export system ATPase subunit
METTIIVVTHRGSLASYADKIVKMDKGAIVNIK